MLVAGREGPDGGPLEVPDDITYAELLKRIGGVAASTEGLGVMVSKPENARYCSPGWTFVPQDSEPEEIQAALDHMSQGRKTWPPRDKSQG